MIASTLNFLNFCGISNIIFIHLYREKTKFNSCAALILQLLTDRNPGLKNTGITVGKTQLLYMMFAMVARPGRQLLSRYWRILSAAQSAGIEQTRNHAVWVSGKRPPL